MPIPRDIVSKEPGLGEWCILAAYRGSTVYGTRQEDSDKDVLAVCVPSPSYYFGCDAYGSRSTKEIRQEPWDIVVYELRKIVGLLAKGNPNSLVLLWTPDHYFITMTPAGELLIKNRELFATRKCYYDFIGYAHGQIHRMTHFDDIKDIHGQVGHKRKELIMKHHYDTKNATECIRILRMGMEFLKDGQLQVDRHDRQQLLEIKRGEWSLERVQAEADRLFIAAEDAFMNSTLPMDVDYNKINELCIEIVKEAWRGKYS